MNYFDTYQNGPPSILLLFLRPWLGPPRPGRPGEALLPRALPDACAVPVEVPPVPAPSGGVRGGVGQPATGVAGGEEHGAPVAGTHRVVGHLEEKREMLWLDMPLLIETSSSAESGTREAAPAAAAATDAAAARTQITPAVCRYLDRTSA